MTEPSSGPLPADAPPPGTYTLDPERTTIRADVKAMFGLITVHGTFRLQAGQGSIAADPGSSSVQASIEAGSFASGNAKRDADVVSATLLDAKTYPDITFTGPEITQVSPSRRTGPPCQPKSRSVTRG